MLTRIKTIGRQRRPQSPGDSLDRDLARAMTEGSRDALQRLVDRHLGPLLRYLERRLGPGHEERIHSVARATLLDALTHLGAYAGGRARLPMRLWLVRRAERHLRRTEAKQPRRANPAENNADWLQSMLDMAPRNEAAVLSMALFERMSPQEIGGALGMSTARAMRRLRRALLRINKHVISRVEHEI